MKYSFPGPPTLYPIKTDR